MRAFLFASAVGVLLTACFEGDDRPDRITATTVDVQDFTVEGTSTPLLPNQPAPISAAENQGRFKLYWETSADGVIDIELAVRGEEHPCTTEEFEFHDEPCGAGQVCGLVDDLSCQFRNDNRIVCERGKGVDLSPFLDQLPKRATITIVARAQHSTHCTFADVEFR